MELYCNNEKKKYWSIKKIKKYDLLGWLQNIKYINNNSLKEQISNISWYQYSRIYHNVNNNLPQSYLYNDDLNDSNKLKNSIKRTYKLRLYPNSSQKKLLAKWAGSARYTYNKTIATLNNRKNNCKSWMSLRNRFVTAKSKKNKQNNFFHNKRWLLETPKHIRLSSVKLAVSMLKSALTNIRRGNIRYFKLGYKKGVI